jgi:hypothetical protein
MRFGDPIFGKIYMITHKASGKMYIGKTRHTVCERLLRHTRQDTSPYIHRALRKHGREAFSVRVIDTALTNAELSRKEIGYIEFYRCRYPNGYNLTAGGDGVPFLSKASKAKLSRSLKQNYIEHPERRVTTAAQLLSFAKHPIRIEKISRHSKAMWKDPKLVANRLAAVRSEDSRKRQSKMMKQLWREPGFAEKVSSGRERAASKKKNKKLSKLIETFNKK